MQPAAGPGLEVARLIRENAAAISRRDLDRHMADYAPDLLMFDAIGPLSFRGLETLRQGWQLCLDSTVGPLALEHHDLEVMVADDLAVATSLMTFQATSKARGIELHSTMRNTTVLRRREGSWKIVHGHGSVPFDPISEKALVDLRLDS